MKVTITDEGLNITKRFFLALDTLKIKKEIRGVKSFTDRYGLNYWNFSTIRKEPEKRIIKTEWLAYLVSDYNVSAEWLLLGTGSMFKDAALFQSETSLP